MAGSFYLGGGQLQTYHLGACSGELGALAVAKIGQPQKAAARIDLNKLDNRKDDESKTRVSYNSCSIMSIDGLK